MNVSKGPGGQIPNIIRLHGDYWPLLYSHPEPGRRERGILISRLMFNGQLDGLLVGKNDGLFSDEGFGGDYISNSASLRKIRVSFPNGNNLH